MKITDILQRAAKTFVQAFVPVIAANAALIGTHIVNWDWTNCEAWLVPIVISAVAAGLSALWNALINAWNKKTEKETETNDK